MNLRFSCEFCGGPFLNHKGKVRHESTCAAKSPEERQYWLKHRTWPKDGFFWQEQDEAEAFGETIGGLLYLFGEDELTGNPGKNPWPADVEMSVRLVRRKAELCEFCGMRGGLKGCKPCKDRSTIACGFHALEHLINYHNYDPGEMR